MNNFINRENYPQRITQAVIFLAHLILLKWILYTLSEGGVLPFYTVLFHFLGISVYGALLIRTCAYIYKRQYEKELKNHAGENGLDS
ncbi:MAG TPA: hypothetical protein VNJ08_13395 [Bacteriovoracaceae bacterium]|nr:hypothetical protein [Bacteriovoracaceae bacterium]